MLLYTGQACSAAFFSSRRFAAASSSFLAVLVFGVLLLMVLIIGYQIIADARARQREAIRRRVREAVGQAVMQATQGDGRAKVKLPGKADLFTRRGAGVLLHVFAEMNDEGCATLRRILMSIGYDKFVKKQLDETDVEDFLIELIRMVAEMQLTGLEGKVSDLLYSHKENVELQFQAFMTLSRLGSAEALARVCLDKDFAQTLSFRSLQQILTAYTGDGPALYAQLLKAPDNYVVRVCIKRIGMEGLADLAPEVENWLDDSSINLVIDAIRTLGLLQYRPAAGRIAGCFKHEAWEVRSIAVSSLAAIDLEGYEDDFVTALQDSEWQVRYNAGKALSGIKDKEALRKKVQATGDKYALEMLEYMMQTAEIWRSA